MNHKLSRIAALGSIVALGALGAPAMATPPAGSPSAGHKPATTPGPHASPSAKAHAYGKYCAAAGASKHHVAGTKGTEFSRCVTAMAKAAQAAKAAEAAKAAGTPVTTPSPAKACAGISKKHVADSKGTPFSRCVSAAAKLLGDKPAG
jgi:hypothetical protein